MLGSIEVEYETDPKLLIGNMTCINVMVMMITCQLVLSVLLDYESLLLINIAVNVAAIATP